MSDFIAGFRYAWTGFGLMFRPGIRLYTLVPLLINALLFAAAIDYGAGLLNDFINTWLDGWWQWLRWLLWPVFILVALTVIFFCFTIVANLIAAPFNGFLAAAVEQRLTGSKTDDGNSSRALLLQINMALASEFRKFIYFMVRAIPLLVLFVIPLVQVAAPFLWLLFGAWMLALEYLDFPMGNHGFLFAEQKHRLRQQRALVSGFGLGVFVVTMIPVVNFLVIPAAVCAATRLYCERFPHSGE